VSPYLDRFAASRGALPGAAVPWLAGMRENAIERLAETGFPTPRIETWKYTDLRRMLRTDFTPPAADSRAAIPDTGAWRLEGAQHLMVFVDGRFAPSLSEIDGLGDMLSFQPLAGALADDPGLLEGRLGAVAGMEGVGTASLNTAFMADGAVLHIAPGAEIEDPVHILFLASGDASGGKSAGEATVCHPRNLIIAGAGSRATVVETYTGFGGIGVAGGAGGYWTNAVTEIVLEPGAELNHYKLQEEEEGAYHTGLANLRLERDATYSGFVMTTGARLARSETGILIAGSGVDCRLNGAYLLRGRQHSDNTTDIEHAGTHSHSRQFFKGVIDGRARAVFQGRVLVRPGAQRTDAHQLNRNLLLSPDARADSKPELVIHADDVKCSHGATVGDLDKDAMFYLRSRGIDAPRARAMLIEGFIGELFDDVPKPAIQLRLRGQLASWLGHQAETEAAA
jgi:Fe-S cluster assembly protein SufD